jgi:hypothetical protein
MGNTRSRISGELKPTNTSPERVKYHPEWARLVRELEKEEILGHVDDLQREIAKARVMVMKDDRLNIKKLMLQFCTVLTAVLIGGTIVVKLVADNANAAVPALPAPIEDAVVKDYAKDMNTIKGILGGLTQTVNTLVTEKAAVTDESEPSPPVTVTTNGKNIPIYEDIQGTRKLIVIDGQTTLSVEGQRSGYYLVTTPKGKMGWLKATDTVEGYVD